MPIKPLIKNTPAPTPMPVPDPDIPFEKAAAVEAVQRYELLRRSVEDAKASFEKSFPEAVSALQGIRVLEDELNEAIAEAKPKVALAKESVGEFVCKRRFSAAHYDGKMVTEIIGGFENAGEVYEDLYRSGVVKSIDFDRDALTARFARDPGYSKAFGAAWREKSELTPAITVPKV